MIVKLTYCIEVDETEYKNLKKSEIRKLIKNAEADGSINDYIKEQVKSTLDSEDFEKDQ